MARTTKRETTQPPLVPSTDFDLRAALEALGPEALARSAAQFGFSTKSLPAGRLDLIGAMVESGKFGLEELLKPLSVDELRGVAKSRGIDLRARTRAPFINALLALVTVPAPAAVVELERTERPPATVPTPRTILGILDRSRLLEIGALAGLPLGARAPADALIDRLIARLDLTIVEWLRYFGRDELRAACRAHGLEASDRARQPLVDRLLAAAGQTPTVGAIARPSNEPWLPRPSDIVVCRHRQYMVEAVHPAPERRDSTRVDMYCLDDDEAGRPLTVMWEAELGAKVFRPEQGVGAWFEGLDPPRHFAAYLHAIRWNSVTATDAKLFQAPFRAGIHVAAFQLTPLMKALELPRANLFIADDVGLGKTIEAGLVLQELLLRQRVDWALIVCPPSVALQWKEEMSKRFGLHFEIHDRAFVARRKRERGFGANAWSTHNRFIITYPLLRRPEYLEPLTTFLNERGRAKSLLILDEAHTVAPATSTMYAVDSTITRVIRESIAPSFENRLFLSATPHNGHSNSFSALLEILDPQRFNRGVEIRGPEQLRPVMVRRLKKDVREFADVRFPTRKVVQIDLEQPKGSPTFELELADLLDRYVATVAAKTKRQRLVMINLQKRLLSSVPAFHRTLTKHARTFDEKLAPALAEPQLVLVEDAGEVDPSDEALARDEDAEIEAGTRELATPQGDARSLLERMLAVADASRGLPDLRVHALLDWMRVHMCPAIGLSPVPGKPLRTWSACRVLIFTESLDTKRWLRLLLESAFAATEAGSHRILELHGGMDDEAREAVQRAFNAPSGDHPVRVLLATDAAREGVNLQGACADLFHFDIPWNPARMEQRNGRIDRTLQPAAEVRCHYFHYRERRADIVLAKLVQKVEVIREELGSLGTVIQDRLAAVLDDRGLDIDVASIDEAMVTDARGQRVDEELETLRKVDLAVMKSEVALAAKIYAESKKRLEFENHLLRELIDVALELMKLPGLEPAGVEDDVAAFALPVMPLSWTTTLDLLRPARNRDMELWDWRKLAPQPVVFDAPKTMTSPRVHLHLHHPFVRRIMDTFTSAGLRHGLHKATVVRDAKAGEPRVLAFGRLSLFGRGAVRLHDELVTIVAPWAAEHGAMPGTGDPTDDRLALTRLEQLFGDPKSLRPISKGREKEIRARMRDDFGGLWPLVRDEAEARGDDAQRRLGERATTEALQLRGILTTQREQIAKKLGAAQLELGAAFNRAEKQQFEDERRSMERRLVDSERELETEPEQLARLYEVKLRRLEPVGLVYMWPDALA